MPLIVKPTNLLAQYMRKNVTSSHVGVVVSAGKMSKAVKVRIAGQEWNKHIRKYFPSPKTYLVADPNSSLLEGDIVRISSGYRFSKQIRHVVTSIVAPFGPPANERPPVLTEGELMVKRLEERLAKDLRAEQRGRLTSKWRLQEARKAGIEIPDLELAMKNVRLQEAEDEKRRLKESKSVKAHVEGEVTSKERRRLQREKTEGELKREAKAKEAKRKDADGEKAMTS